MIDLTGPYKTLKPNHPTPNTQRGAPWHAEMQQIKYYKPVLEPQDVGLLLRSLGWNPTEAEVSGYVDALGKSHDGHLCELIDVLHLMRKIGDPTVRGRRGK